MGNKNKKEDEIVEKGEEELQLECIRSDEEKLKYSKDMAEAISKKARAEDSLKSFQTQQKAEIASHDATINLLAEKVNTGREYRKVGCKILFNFTKKIKSWARIDTGEIARTLPLDESDYQESIV